MNEPPKKTTSSEENMDDEEDVDESSINEEDESDDESDDQNGDEIDEENDDESEDENDDENDDESDDESDDENEDEDFDPDDIDEIDLDDEDINIEDLDDDELFQNENKDGAKISDKNPDNNTNETAQNKVSAKNKKSGMDLFKEAVGKNVKDKKSSETEQKKEKTEENKGIEKDSKKETPQDDKTTQKDENSDKDKEKVEDKEKEPGPKKLTGHTIPTEPSWHIKRNKSGFTLPKSIRKNIHMEQDFALVVKDNQLIFYMINEEDITKLNQVKKKKAETSGGKKSKGRKKAAKNKEPEGPQPEWGRYFLFEFEDQDKLKEVLETAFFKFTTNPPNVQEAMDLIKYALVSFLKSSRMNDARVRQTIIFFMCDVIEKFDQPNLIDYAQTKIIPEIKSRFLYQLCLAQLAYTGFKTKRYEKAQEFINTCLEDIAKYTDSEMYAIMDSFKNLIIKLTRDVDFLVPQDQFIPIRDALLSYQSRIEDNDYNVQIIEQLDRMRFISEAHELAEKVLANLPEESPTRDTIKELLKTLTRKPI